MRLGDKLYLASLKGEQLNGLRVLRNGLLLGEFGKDRLEPAQAWAMTLRAGQVKNEWNLPLEDDRVIRYLKGETLDGDGAPGWTLVLAEGYPLGWAKQSGGRLKARQYLKAWKMN